MLQIAARMERVGYPEPPHLATVASVEGQSLRLCQSLPAPADVWRSPPEVEADTYVLELPVGSATLLYHSKDEAAGMATAVAVDHYLDEAHLPHEMTVLPSSHFDIMGVTVASSLHTVSVRTGAEGPRAYATVDSVEFIGSALYAAFHIIRAAGPQRLRSMQCGTGPRRRLEFGSDTIAP